MTFCHLWQNVRYVTYENWIDQFEINFRTGCPIQSLRRDKNFLRDCVINHPIYIAHSNTEYFPSLLQKYKHIDIKITHIQQVINMFESSLLPFTVKCIKNNLIKRNVSVISLMMFYDNRKIIVYKLIGSVIYTILENYICIDYLSLLRDN